MGIDIRSPQVEDSAPKTVSLPSDAIYEHQVVLPVLLMDWL